MEKEHKKVMKLGNGYAGCGVTSVTSVLFLVA